MPAKLTLPRYYQRPKVMWRSLSPIVALFFVTIIYASGLHNHTVRMAIYYLSLAYPLLILCIFSFATPKLSYFCLDSDGLYITFLGVIRRRILWADIEKVSDAAIGNIAAIGLMYKPTFNRYVFGRKFRRKMSGWDELLGNAQSANGKSFIKDARKSYETHYNRSRLKERPRIGETDDK